VALHRPYSSLLLIPPLINNNVGICSPPPFPIVHPMIESVAVAQMIRKIHWVHSCCNCQ
jgi:hypothetical protein